MSFKTKRVLHSIYKFLYRITFKQNKARKILEIYIDTFIDHLND